jgi:hypothetical protein
VVVAVVTIVAVMVVAAMVVAVVVVMSGPDLYNDLGVGRSIEGKEQTEGAECEYASFPVSVHDRLLADQILADQIRQTKFEKQPAATSSSRLRNCL